MLFSGYNMVCIIMYLSIIEQYVVHGYNVIQCPRLRVELTEHISRFLIKSRKEGASRRTRCNSNFLVPRALQHTLPWVLKPLLVRFRWMSSLINWGVLWFVRCAVVFEWRRVSILRKNRCNQRALLDFGRILATFHAKVKGCKFL